MMMTETHTSHSSQAIIQLFKALILTALTKMEVKEAAASICLRILTT